MADGIEQGFMEAQSQLSLELPARHRFEQQLHQGSQLEGGWGDEICPAQRQRPFAPERDWTLPLAHQLALRFSRPGWFKRASIRRTPRSWLTRGMCPSGASIDHWKLPG